MTDLTVTLHDAQMEIFRSPKRFKVASCGRRFGKSYLAAWVLIIQALQSKTKDVFYVAPTFQQAKDIPSDEVSEVAALGTVLSF